MLNMPVSWYVHKLQALSFFFVLMKSTEFLFKSSKGRVLKEGLVRKTRMKRTKDLDQDRRDFRIYVQSTSEKKL